MGFPSALECLQRITKNCDALVPEIEWAQISKISQKQKRKCCRKDGMGKSVKIIFLDVDGVLNCEKTTRTTKSGTLFVGSGHLKRLRDIIKATGAKVVLSSDWRYGRDEPESNGDFLELQRELRRYGIEIFDYTPVTCFYSRGGEISIWLSRHPEVSDYVILDDLTDMGPHMSRLVQTSVKRGLGKEEVKQAINILEEI